MGTESPKNDNLTTSKVSTEPKFHPKFNDPSADVILSSKDGTFYRIHRTTLQSASGTPRSLLPGPCSVKGIPFAPSINTISESNNEVVNLPFPNTSLERVLLMMTLQEVPPLSSIKELEDAADVMEYLGARGLPSHIRELCFSPVLQSEPLRLYRLGARFGWEDVKQHAAKRSLHLDLFPVGKADATEIENQLSQLDGRSAYQLFRLHQREGPQPKRRATGIRSRL